VVVFHFFVFQFFKNENFPQAESEAPERVRMKGLVLLIILILPAWALVSPLRGGQENKQNTLREKHKRYHQLRNANVGCLEAAQIEKGV
jgi:hypothetical protein